MSTCYLLGRLKHPGIVNAVAENLSALSAEVYSCLPGELY